MMENGCSKEEADSRLREKGIGLVDANTIVIKTFNTLRQKYTKLLMESLKDEKEVDIDKSMVEIVPSGFIEIIQMDVEKKYIRAIREEVIFEFQKGKPIEEVLRKYQNNRVSRKQIKRWIISYYYNLKY